MILQRIFLLFSVFFFPLEQMQNNESWSRRLQTYEHPADAQTRSWEDSSGSRKVTLRDLHGLSHPIHSASLSESHHHFVFIHNESFIPLLIFLPFFSVFHQSLSRLPRLQWRQQTWGGGFLWNAGSCSGSRPVCTPVISTVWSLCFPREASGLPPTPCPPSKTHTYTHRDVFWM